MNLSDIKYDLILCGSRTFKSKKGFKERRPELVFSSDINGKENVNANNWYFKIQREEAAVRSGNLNPALLSCIGSDVLINKQKLELEKSRVLLDDDVITLTSIKKKFKFVYLRGHQLDLNMGRFSSNLKNKYYIGKKLGAGCNGAVHLAYDITFKAFAIKTLMRSSNDENAIQREIKTMRFIKHPNLLELFEVICDEDRVHLVTEHMNVGDMIEMINLWPMKSFTERDAKFFITQVVRGVEHLHQHNIGHMDIKLDNIFVKVKNQEYILKLGDFGYSHFDFNIQFKCGTRLYSSPEIFDKQNLVISGKQCDMWAVGVVLFCILTGHFPFHDDYSSKIKLDQQIKKVHIKWSHKEVKIDQESS